MKKYLASVLTVAILVCCCMTPGVSGISSKAREMQIAQNAEAFLTGIAKQGETGEFMYLYNFAGEPAAVYYKINPGGYLVADYTDGHVIEYCPVDGPALNLGTRYYYAGPLEFYVETSDGYLNVLSREMVNPSQIMISQDMHTASDNVPIKDYGPTYLQSTNDTSFIGQPKNYIISESPDKLCVIAAITNGLQWLKDYNSKDVYAEGVSSAKSLCTFLEENSYVDGTDGITWEEAVYGSYNVKTERSYEGLAAYSNRNDVSTIRTIITTSTPTNIKNQIGYSRPVLLMIRTSILQRGTGNHAVFIYGYQETANDTYYIVNDTWGHNSVYIDSSDIEPATDGILALW